VAELENNVELQACQKLEVKKNLKYKYEIRKPIFL
jgi:hypothetical protein